MDVQGRIQRAGFGLLFGVIGVVAASAAHAVTITWDGSSSGLWQTPANWDLNRVPGAGDDVVIPDLAGTAVVTHTGTTSVNSLTCAEALSLTGTLNLAAASVISGSFTLSGILDGAGSVTISGPFTWSSGNMQGTGTTTISPGVNWSLPMGAAINLLRPLNNDGAAFQTGTAQFGITSPGIFRNRAGATLDWRGTSTINGSGSLENQAGALLKRTTSTGTTSWNLANFSNAGTLSLESGTLGLDGASASITGTITSLAGTTLALNGAGTSRTVGAGATLNLAGAVAMTNGTITIDAAATVAITGAVSITAGTLNTNRDLTLPSLSMGPAGTLDGAGHIVITTACAWSGGTMQGTGTTTINPGVTWTMPMTSFAQLKRTLNNDGACTQTGGPQLAIDSPGLFRNRSGGSLDWRGAATILGTGALENQAGGVLKRTNATGSASWGVATFTNAGTLSLESSTLVLGGVSTTITGVVSSLAGTTLTFTNVSNPSRTVSAGAVLNLAGAVNHAGGTTTVDPAATVTVPGALTLTGGTLVMGANVSLPNFTFESGTWEGAGNLALTGAFNWSGGVMRGAGVTSINPGTNWTLSPGLVLNLERALNNDGTGTRTATQTWNITAPGVFRNRAGGSLDCPVDAAISGTGLFDNQVGSTFIKSAGGGTALITSPFTNNGTLRVLSGTLQSSGSFSNFAAQTLTGGSYEIAGTFKFAGADIRTNAATIVLDGASAAIVDQFNANGIATLTTNNAGASLTLKNGKTLATSALLLNNGTVVVGPGAGSSLTANTGYRQNAGLTTLSGGTLASSAFVELLGGTLNGSGSVTGNLTNAATVSAGTSPGAISVSGNYTQQAAGTLVAEIAGVASGTQFDALTIGGTATLGGNLNVSLISGFVPTPLLQFPIVVAATRAGTFATDNLPFPSGVNCIDVTYPPNVVLVGCFAGVAITGHPAPQTVCAPGPADFSVTATGTSLAFQWRRNGIDIINANSSSFSIPVTNAGDAGSYDCVVTNPCGSATSNAATLSISTAPVITTHPASQSVCAGSQVTFSVVATGTNLIYQWRKGVALIPGATSSSHTIAAVTPDDAGSYNCVVESIPCTAISSNGATLTVSSGVAITQQPQNQAGCFGGTVTLSVVATGASPTFQWRKGGVDIGGATASSLALLNLAAADAGSYDVVITGSCGTLTSASATVTVQDCPATVFVNAAAAPGGDGQSWGTAFDNLQTALGSVAGTLNTREIWVAAGTYRPHVSDRGATFQLLNRVRLYGGFAGGETLRTQRDPSDNPTILSGDLAGDDGPGFAGNAENSIHVVNGDAVDSTAALDGFVIRAGNANTTGPGTSGGGLTISSNGRPAIADCVFESNFASGGGGAIVVNNTGSEFLLTGCAFTGNAVANATGNLSGGALSLVGGLALLTDCSFDGNTVTQAATATSRPGGGAITISGAAVAQLLRGVFTGNSHSAPGGTTLGGALRVISATANLVDCRFLGNTLVAGSGGTALGGAVTYSSAGAGGSVVNCLFSGNTAGQSGGAVDVIAPAAVTFRNSTFAGNTAGTSAGGLLVSTTVVTDIDNCIFYGNRVGIVADEAAQIGMSIGSTAPTVDFCIVQGLTGALGGSANLGTDPLFVDPDGADNTIGTPDDDLTPGANSPAIDSGSNAQVPGGVTTDVAGQPRFIDDPCVTDTGAGGAPLVDRGSYERQTSSCASAVVDPPVTTGRAGLGIPSPNPSAHGFAVGLTLPARGRVRASVVDAVGRQVALLLDAELAAGERTIRWDGLSDERTRVAAGFYFLRVVTPFDRQARKVVVLP